MNSLAGGRGKIPATCLILLLALVACPLLAEEPPARKPPPIKELAKVVVDGTKSDRDRVNAAHLLAAVPDHEAILPILKVIQDPKEKGIMRAAMVRALALSTQKQEVIPFLKGYLDKKEGPPEVRAAAAFALGSLGDPSSKPLLLRASSDPQPEVRQAARSAILTIGGEGVDQPGILIATLKDRDQPWTVRSTAARQLCELREARAFVPLLEILKEKVPETPPKNPEDFFAARITAKRNLPAAAARALGCLGNPKATPTLLTLTETPDAELRVAVFEALATLKTHEAVPVARQALVKDKEQRVRRWAAVLLREVRAKDALPELRQALSDPDPGVRLQAAQAVGAARDQQAIEPLGKALAQETTKEVKEAIGEALRLLKSPVPPSTNE